MDYISGLSNVVYAELCRTIGSQEEVTIRRDVLDMAIKMAEVKDKYEGWKCITSGSRREGFRFNSSDADIMRWEYNSKVINDISQRRIYDESKHTIILMEANDTPPGFVTLQLLSSPEGHIFVSITFNDKSYLSNFLWRLVHLKSVDDHKIFLKAHHHGPCATGKVGGVEFDLLFCFASSFWPKMADGWTKRCLYHTWPSSQVCAEILREGCHCVPIASKITTDKQKLEREWRLSFSQAEQKLVYEMNHTQFLCYGLLKLFLKEIINNKKEKPLFYENNHFLDGAGRQFELES